VARVVPFSFPVHRTGLADLWHLGFRLASSHGKRGQALDGLGHPFDNIVMALERFKETKGA
jgi:hypothetical protein